MSSDAPPWRAEATTSLTCRDSVDVKTLTNSGIRAPASVPQLTMVESFHHIVVSPPRFGTINAETRYVRPMEANDVIQTRVVSGISKFIRSACAYRALAIAALM